MHDTKSVVRRFNIEVIQNGDRATFLELMAEDFVNYAAPPGTPTGPEGMWHTFSALLRPAMPDLRVIIHDQIAEGEKVVTRKSITGTLTGPLLGIDPTGEVVSIDVIDVVRIRDGKYAEHWGVNTLGALIAKLRG